MSNQAIRFTFSYRGDSVRLEATEELEMTPLPAESEVPPETALGPRYELLDADGRVLYRRLTRNLIPFAVEVPIGEPDQPFVRATVANPRGLFDVVVPDLEAATTLVLYARTRALELERPGNFEGADEIFRLDLG